MRIRIWRNKPLTPYSETTQTEIRGDTHSRIFSESRLNLRKPQVQIVLQIDHGFQPHGDTQQGLGDSARCPLLGCDATMRGCRRVRQRGFGIAEIGRDRQQTATVDHFPGFASRALDFEGDDGSAAFLLAPGEFEAWLHASDEQAHALLRRMPLFR